MQCVCGIAVILLVCGCDVITGVVVVLRRFDVHYVVAHSLVVEVECVVMVFVLAEHVGDYVEDVCVVVGVVPINVIGSGVDVYVLLVDVDCGYVCAVDVLADIDTDSWHCV